MSLDLTPGAGNLLGESYWEICSPWRGDASTLNTGVSPREEKESFLSQILEPAPLKKYYLTKTACLGILRRARERGKELPEQLKAALEIQAGVTPPDRTVGLGAYHMNQRDEGIDLGGVSGALMATSNMQMQTFIAEGCLTPWDTQQERIFTPDAKAPTLAGADGGGGRNPAGLLFAASVVTKGGGRAGQGYPCVMTAGFCAGAGPSAGGIGYTEEVSPTLKAASSGTNMVPSILCLNDQGGAQMHCTEDKTGTLRAQEHGHQPLVMATQQGGAEIGVGICPTITAAAGMSGNNQPVLFENHGIDSRYTGPHPVAPTMSARYGTGGNNVPLVSQEPDSFCIAGNIIDRQVKNGGNGLGCQKDIAYTLTATDHHAVFHSEGHDQTSTDLTGTYQEVVGALCRGDEKGVGSQYVSQDKCIVERTCLIRRLTPLECERLQGFPDGWTSIPGASDSARYKALGNSVAIPCVEFVLHGIATVLRMAG